jgi:hypothetical protein
MKKEIYQGPLLFFALLFASTIGLGAQGLLIGHIDFTTYYSTELNEWISEFRHGEWENPDARTPTNEVSLHARDIPVNQDAEVPEEIEGDRYVQPYANSFDFTGIPDGEPLWIFSAADNGHSWPGFRNDQTTGTFRSYVPNDSRVISVAQPWMTLELINMTYAGSSNNPQFSLWQYQGGVIQWMATSDGIDSDDIYYMKENAHSHANIGFSSLGLYRISYKPSAILEATGESIVGTIKSLTFAIGSKAAWTASYYAGDDLFVGTVSGDESDSDMDGIELLLEYAFNLNPISADFKILEAGNGTYGLPLISLISSGTESVLQIEYIRRKSETNPQISYFPEFSSSLAGGEWEVQTAETVTSIDGEWERVIVSDLVGTSTYNKRFGRIRIEVQEIISY